MSKYIVTYTEYIHSRGCNNGFFLCDTLKEAKDKVLMLQNNKHFIISDIRLFVCHEQNIDYLKEN